MKRGPKKLRYQPVRIPGAVVGKINPSAERRGEDRRKDGKIQGGKNAKYRGPLEDREPSDNKQIPTLRRIRKKKKERRKQVKKGGKGGGKEQGTKRGYLNRTGRGEWGRENQGGENRRGV